MVQTKNMTVLLCVLVISGTFFVRQNSGHAQQIPINRIEMMPNRPLPYLMRNWKQVTIEYDNFVFDFTKTGQYLPLIWWRTGTVNYPAHISFGLHTVVGTRYPNSAEAINVIPAVISASLVGIDKSNQGGYNWVLMCEEYFNRANNANVYLNHPSGSNWDDWWYDTMPNIFFYQLYDQYRHTGDFDFQFISVADRWLAAVMAMGGGTTPWQIPNLNYRAFNLMTMTPYAASPREPEAAGAIAWLLYNAYKETGLAKYRAGAELCVEFLHNWNTNPSYELQLPYGAHIAARMNAELNTQYNITKILDWCFTTTGNVRNWGAIVGNWGGYECSGLIGEVSSNDYAFTMNTFEQVGALLPLVRYDERFARAIGKWVLNAANAARLFYSNYLPNENQDSEVWAHQYDSTSVIAYEAMRRYSPYQPSISPFATGDAVTGGWGNTNLTLYGSSHVGILGGVIDTTDVAMILQLNTLKTDYFHEDAYPTYLHYNPYPADTLVTLQLGTAVFDLYESVNNNFIAYGATGAFPVNLPADQAYLIVYVPAGGTISYHLEKMLVNGVIVDYHANVNIPNYPPRIKSLSASPELLLSGEVANLYCTATDREPGSLTFDWTCSAGQISGSGAVVSWTAPGVPGLYDISCAVFDAQMASDTAAIQITVVEYINNPPVISAISASPGKINLNASSHLLCTATDPDGDSLIYHWSAAQGILADSANTAVWTAPAQAGDYYITCRVDDGRGGEAVDSIGMVVRDFSIVQTGKLVAFYPFNGNAHDASGNGYHGTVSGALLAPDRFGNPDCAYFFDGVNDYIRIPNHDSLNFRQAITVNFWMKLDQFYTREAFPISHGSWENRWKSSIIPERKLRWTIKTNHPVNNGIIDLDTRTILILNTWYNVTLYYDGTDFDVYLNGNLDNFAHWSGLLLTTTYDLTIGQMLPNNYNYNFRGVLDDIRIFNYGLSVEEIENLASIGSGLDDHQSGSMATTVELRQNYPNPFNPLTTITFSLPYHCQVTLTIFDITGKVMATVVDQKMAGGIHQVRWNASKVASGIYFYRLQADQTILTRKMILLR